MFFNGVQIVDISLDLEIYSSKGSRTNNVVTLIAYDRPLDLLSLLGRPPRCFSLKSSTPDVEIWSNRPNPDTPSHDSDGYRAIAVLSRGKGMWLKLGLE